MLGRHLLRQGLDLGVFTLGPFR